MFEKVTAHLGLLCLLFLFKINFILINSNNKENKVDKDIPIAQTIIAIENAHDDEVWFLSSDHNIYVWDVYSVTFTRTIKIPLFVNSNLRSPSLPTVTNSSPNIPYFNAISDANATKTSSLQPNTSRAQRKQSCPNTSIPKSSSFGNSLSDGDEFDDSLEMDWENITNPNSFIQDQLAGIRRIGNHVWIYHSNDIITVLDSEVCIFNLFSLTRSLLIIKILDAFNPWENE